MKFSHKLAYPIILSALATTSCASINLPKPSVPTFGLGKKAQEKRAQKAYKKQVEAASQKHQGQTPAHLAYTQNNGKMTKEVLGQVSRTDPLNRVKFWADAYNKNPSDAQTILSFVKGLREIKSQEKAIEIATHGLVIHPSFAALKVEQGKAFSSMGQTGQAVRVFRDVLQTNPMLAEAHAALALALERSGNSAEAQSAFQQAISLEPNRVETLSNFGMSVARTGNLPQAVALLQRAYSLAPSDSTIQSNYALLLGMAGQYDQMRQVNLGTPQALAQSNEAILRQMSAPNNNALANTGFTNNGFGPAHASTASYSPISPPRMASSAPIQSAKPRGASALVQSQPTAMHPPATYGYAAPTTTPAGYQNIGLPYNNQQPSYANPATNFGPSQGSSAPYGVAAARAALQGQDTYQAAAQAPQAHQYQPAAQQPQYPYGQPSAQTGFQQPTPQSGPYGGPAGYAHPPAQPYGQQRSPTSPMGQTLSAPQANPYGQNAPYQVSSYNAPAQQPPSNPNRNWGAYEVEVPPIENGPNLEFESHLGQSEALTGGFPYSAKSYLQGTKAKPEYAPASDPPPLSGFSY